MLVVLPIFMLLQLGFSLPQQAQPSKPPLAFKDLLISAPLSNNQVTEAKKKDLEPKSDNPNAPDVKQPANAGKTSTSISAYIVGGADAYPIQFPWHALIRMDNVYLCGGSLILSQWVMTAAQCTDGFRSFAIILGRTTLSGTSGAISSTTTKYQHPNYSSPTIANDISLLKLNVPVVFTASISPIKLPPQSDATKTFAGILATVSGYGKTSEYSGLSSILKYAQVSVITNTQCATQHSIVISSTICTSTTGKSICTGDSGGPLVYRNSTTGVWNQIGIVSFASSKGCLAAPSGYARVTSFLGWISTTVGQAISG